MIASRKRFRHFLGRRLSHPVFLVPLDFIPLLLALHLVRLASLDFIWILLSFFVLNVPPGNFPLQELFFVSVAHLAAIQMVLFVLHVLLVRLMMMAIARLHVLHVDRIRSQRHLDHKSVIPVRSALTLLLAPRVARIVSLVFLTDVFSGKRSSYFINRYL